mgnify:CR=1 FL=1
MNKIVSLYIDELMLDKLDIARGDVTKSAWIRRAIEERLMRDGYARPRSPAEDRTEDPNADLI